MKKALSILIILFITGSYGQELKQIPQINVNGEGKVKVVPDEAKIEVTVETKGNNVKDVKKQNDVKIEAALKVIKKMNLAPSDFKTQRVALNPQYDYEKKKHNYNATQTIEILLKDLSKYDELMEGLVDAGINRIDTVTFQSSKLVQYQSEARKLAMTISDNSQNYYPQPRYATMKTMEMADTSGPRETIALGEINIIANVTVSFILE
jgi:hypothetical protein